MSNLGKMPESNLRIVKRRQNQQQETISRVNEDVKSEPRNRSVAMIRLLFAGVSFLILLVAVYGNSLDCSWQFDDFQNIVENQRIQVKEWTWNAIFGIIQEQHARTMFRPLAYLSFAVNHTIGGLDPFNYHVTNLLIHYLTTLFLFAFIHRTLNLPLMSGRYAEKSYLIALLATVFWAIHPVHVSAVTYVVQRMASMATFFYILAMYFYLLARSETGRMKQAALFIFCAFAGLLSIGTKENTAMLPVSLFFYELLLLKGTDARGAVKKTGMVLIAMLPVIAAFFLFTDFSSVLRDYEMRPFTLAERLLTEPRVILYYVTLLIYPVTPRLTLIHEFEISTSLFHPWTTIPAMCLLLFAVWYAFRNVQRRPLSAFCILFFLLNHVIEGSVIPLEILYEHRNYLPSLFFFLPLAILIAHALERFKNARMVYISIVAFCSMLIVVLGMTVYLQNRIWKSELSLWTDNAEKSAGMHRPHHNLGIALMRSGRISEGVQELEKALLSRNDATVNQKYTSHYELGRYYFFEKNYSKSFFHFKETLKWAPLYPDPYHFVARIMCVAGKSDDAQKFILRAINLQEKADYHITDGLIRLQKGDPRGAIQSAQMALRFKENDNKAYSLLAEAYRSMHKDAEATEYRKLSGGVHVSCGEMP